MNRGQWNALSPGRKLTHDWSGVTRLLMVVLGVLSLVGAYVALRDVEGESLLPNIVLAAPTVVAMVATLELLWRATPMSLGSRVFIASILTTIPNTLVSTAAWAIAGVAGEGTIESSIGDSYDHYWWPEDARGMTGALFHAPG